MGKKTLTGNWSRTTNKDKRFPIKAVDREGTAVRLPEPLVLVGFGKHDLADMIDFIDTDNEERLISEPFEKGWPPRYRRASACTEQEINNFKKFTNFMTQVVAQ